MIAQSWKNWCWKWRSASWLVIGGALASLGDYALAQIAPDTTLGAERSVVKPNIVINDLSSTQIDGGATRGANLFHSFEQFNVDEGRAAYFTNPTGIENILSRVTGDNRSTILGKLGVLGNANLFLINPNGIIFGPNASLDVKGSFVATTANAIRLGDTGLFSASEPATSNLLIVRPSALFFNAVAAQGIVNQSRAQSLRGETNSLDGPVGLQVSTSETLALVGGNVVLEGGNLTAAGGRIELGSVAGSGLVSLTSKDAGWALGYEGIQNFQDIQFQQAVVDASGEGGGNIQVQGRRVTLTDGSQIAAKTLGPNVGGTLTMNASDSVEVSGASADGEVSRLTTRTESAGAAGNLTITTEKLVIEEGAQVSAGTRPRSTGPGGTLTVNASDSVEVSGASADGDVLSRLTTRTEGGGAAGNLTITTGSLVIRDGAQVSTGTEEGSTGAGGNLTVNASDSIEVSGASADGDVLSRLTTRTEGDKNAGNLTITTGKLTIQAGGEVSTSTVAGSTGSGGNLTVNASDLVVSGSAGGEDSSRLTTRTTGAGNAGPLTITTGKLTVEAGGQISTGTRPQSTGSGGNLTVNASDSVEVSGASADGDVLSRLTTRTESSKAAGNLTITTGNLFIRDGAQVSAGTEEGSTGAGGSLTVNASDSVEVAGFATTIDGPFYSSRLTTRTEGGGAAGNLTITTGNLVIRDGAQVPAGTVYGGKGSGGNLTVNASGSVKVIGSVIVPGDRVSSRLTNRTETEGAAGNLKITAGELIVRDWAEIGVNSRFRGSGEAGNLEVTARSIQLDNHATLNARAASVSGGNITLQVQESLLLRRNSQISATAGTAQAGGDGGNINIDTKILAAVPLENSDITASAFEGNGGNIQITAQGIFGTQFQDIPTPESDITASSRFGVDGVVEINTPDVDPSSGLVNLSAVPIDTEVAQGCQPGGSQAQSKFVVTGRGGLPPSPSEALSSDAIQVDWVTLNPGVENRSSPSVSTNPTAPEPVPIVEAQGWVIGDDGKVILTARVPTIKPHSPWRPATCHAAK